MNSIFAKYIGMPLGVAFSLMLVLFVLVATKAGPEALQDPLTWFAILFLVILVGIAMRFKRRLGEDLEYREREHAELLDWTQKLQNAEFGDFRKLKEDAPSIIKNILLLFYPSGVPNSAYENRPVVITSVDPVSYVDDQFESKFEQSDIARFGGAITGVALFFTFALISPAVIEIGQSLSPPKSSATLTGDGGAAIGQAQEQPKSTEGNAALKSAIVSIGGKFVISATGVLLAVALSLELDRRRRTFMRKVNPTIRQLRDIGCTREELDLVIQMDQLDHARRNIEKQENIIKTLESLSDIEVSLKALGSEVVVQMQDMISKSIGESLERLLDQQKDQMQVLAEQIAKVVSEGLSSHMTALLGSVTQQLESISKSINQKGDSQFSEAISKLTEAISGKISGGAESLNKSLEVFATTMPDLIMSLKQASEDMKSGTKTAIDSQKAGQQDLLESLNSAVNNIVAATDGIRGGIQTGGRELEEQYSKIRAGMEGLSVGLIGTIEEFKTAIAEVQQAGKTLGESGMRVQPVYRQLEEAASKLRSTSEDFVRVGSTLVDAPASFRDSFVSANEAVNRQTITLQSQVAQWESLLAEVVQASKLLNQESQKSFTEGANTVKAAFAKLGEFVEAVEELSSGIEVLSARLKRDA